MTSILLQNPNMPSPVFQLGVPIIESAQDAVSEDHHVLLKKLSEYSQEMLKILRTMSSDSSASTSSCYQLIILWLELADKHGLLENLDREILSRLSDFQSYLNSSVIDQITEIFASGKEIVTAFCTVARTLDGEYLNISEFEQMTKTFYHWFKDPCRRSLPARIPEWRNNCKKIFIQLSSHSLSNGYPMESKKILDYLRQSKTLQQGLVWGHQYSKVMKETWTEQRFESFKQKLNRSSNFQHFDEKERLLLLQVVMLSSELFQGCEDRLLYWADQFQKNSQKACLITVLEQALLENKSIQDVLLLLQTSSEVIQSGSDFIEEKQDLHEEKVPSKVLFCELDQNQLRELRQSFTQPSDTVQHPLSLELFDMLADKLKMTYSLIGERQSWDLKQISQHAQLLQEQKKFDSSELLSLGYLALHKILGLQPYPTQLLTVLALLEPQESAKGLIAQIRTGEGKSLIVTLVAFVLAMRGRRIDIVSSSPYLSMRDQQKFSSFFEVFKISTSHICERMPKDECFFAQIVYGTNHDFEFALLRAWLPSFWNQNNGKAILLRGFDCALIDEVDNLFVDIAMNAARIGTEKQEQHDWIWPLLLEFVRTIPEHLNLDKAQSFSLLRKEFLSLYPSLQKHLEAIPDEVLELWISSAWKVLNKLHEGIDYVIKPIINEQQEKKLEVLIVDKDNTGRCQEGSRWSYGIHQLLECKHGLVPKKETVTPLSIAHNVYFANYRNLYGVTGTVGEERDEIRTLYGVKSLDIPPHRSYIGTELPQIILENSSTHLSFLLDQMRHYQEQKRSILILFATIEESEHFSNLLQKEGLSFQLFNDIKEENEDHIIKRAGLAGMITVATNKAGRGIDIIPSQDVLEQGGLHVIVTFFPANKRVQAQDFGRTARQGNPGSYQLIVCREHPSVKQFLGENTDIRDPESFFRFLEIARQYQNKILSKSRLDRASFERDRHEELKKFINKIQTWVENINEQWLEKLSANVAYSPNESFTHENLFEDAELRIAQNEIAKVLELPTQNARKFILKSVRDIFLSKIFESWASEVYEKIDVIEIRAESSSQKESELKRLYENFWNQWEPFLNSPQQGFLNFLSKFTAMKHKPLMQVFGD